MAKNRDGGGSTRGMNSKGKTVSFAPPKNMPQLKPSKPTEAIVAKGQKPKDLGKSTKDNRFASNAKTPVKQAGKGFAGSGGTLASGFKDITKGDMAKALLAITSTPSSGQFSKWAATKIGGAADTAAFGAASKGLTASGAGGKVSRTMTPMGPTLRSTRIGTSAQQAARMENLLKNADRIATQTGRNMAAQTKAAIAKAGSTARSVAATGVTAKIVKDSKKKTKK